ncbi:hypothetical protein K239x_53700 [Planctomycetes bacterium K23_9]|uniref:Uncharacterized protein n=1 Tax=Stieleria marina TaxID=1930275 RepID=A0A517P1V1_9BACT|nr:hypothetical protein K239x_53700 [Planctomycetes bacterium K23_9]
MNRILSIVKCQLVGEVVGSKAKGNLVVNPPSSSHIFPSILQRNAAFWCRYTNPEAGPFIGLFGGLCTKKSVESNDR